MLWVDCLQHALIATVSWFCTPFPCPGHSYRDVQVLVREPRGKWIVEVQVIPSEMYALKQSCGHKGYTQYRFILEACKRARFKIAATAVLAGGGLMPFAAKSAALSPPQALPGIGTRRASATSLQPIGGHGTSRLSLRPLSPMHRRNKVGPTAADSGPSGSAPDETAA